MVSRCEEPGTFERPNTAPMQEMADGLRALAVYALLPARVALTARCAADMIELQADWLLDQHRMMERQSGLIDQQNDTLKESLRIIQDLRDRLGE